MSFNNEFDRLLAEAKGGDLIITWVGDCPVLPENYHEHYLPISVDDLRAKMAQEPSGVVRMRLDDGTRVILVYGRDVDGVLKVVEQLELVPAP
jgi:hypothetical protein